MSLMRRGATLVVAGTSVAASIALVKRWDEWLAAAHEHVEEHERADGRGNVMVRSSRPRRLAEVAKGVLSCWVFLAAVDILLARRMRDDTSRYFLLHTLANWVITVSSASDTLAVLQDPIGAALGACNMLPSYMMPCLFSYHLGVFRNVPREEWEHHLLFGAGLTGPGLGYCVGPVQNAVAFFMCGLPGGIDYGMLAAVKEGLLAASTEKVWNARIQVWCRSPGILLASYALYLISRHSTSVKVPVRALPLASLAFALCAFNGQYYMQKVVANTAHKCNGQGAC
jgi:hypothetical protein